MKSSVLFEVQSFEVGSFEVVSFEVQSFEVGSFEVQSYEVRSFEVHSVNPFKLFKNNLDFVWALEALKQPRLNNYEPSFS